ncbi:hypothetical protein EBB07_22660 [Paenibacillaceae bacterium]|nr:hypothetical protein EBB07_22660 [Paenibacillaceae bacterium]
MKKIMVLMLMVFTFAATAVLPQSAFAATPKIVHIDSGYHLTAIHKSDGSVWMTGNRNSVPLRLHGVQDAVTAIPRIGDNYQHHDTLVLYQDGTVWSVPVDSAAEPERLTELEDVVELKDGLDYYIALKRDGTVWTWGSNSYGQLGNGTFNAGITKMPKQVKGLSSIVAVSASENFSLALADDGKVYTWGWWSQGASISFHSKQYARTTPIRVQGLPKVTAISAGSSLAMAVDEDGYVYTWGRNALELKTGERMLAFIQTPQRIETISDVIDIGVGPVTLYLTRSGEVWQTGQDWQLPYTGQYKESLTPKRLPKINNAVKITVRDNTRFVLDADGNAFGWGYAINGHLGTGKIGWGNWELTPAPVLHPLSIVVNDVEQPYTGVLHQGVTQVPLRKLASQLGGKLSYQHETKEVTLTKGHQSVTFVPGDSAVEVDGKIIGLGGEIRNYNNETYVPLRFFSELFGASVRWDAEAGRIL